MHRPNVNIEWEGIQEVVEDGIKLKEGRTVQLDAIIFSTGFSLVSKRAH